MHKTRISPPFNPLMLFLSIGSPACTPFLLRPQLLIRV